MRWITCDEAPLDKNIHMVACRFNLNLKRRFKVHFDTWRYTEAKWFDGVCYVWFQEGAGTWLTLGEIKSIDTSACDYQWLLED